VYPKFSHRANTTGGGRYRQMEDPNRGLASHVALLLRHWVVEQGGDAVQQMPLINSHYLQPTNFYLNRRTMQTKVSQYTRRVCQSNRRMYYVILHAGTNLTSVISPLVEPLLK